VLRRLAGAVLGLLVIAGLVAIGYAVRVATEPEQPPPTTIATEMVAVTRTDLVRTETLDGTLGFEGRAPVRSAVPGTVTALPAEAQILGRGDAAFEIDGQPVLVLFGERPAWRPMADGVDDGVDVLQLESNLAALGFGPDGWEPDEEFDRETADAVETWREEIGLPEGDEVELGRVVFVEGDTRVGALLAEEGQAVTAGSPVFEATELVQRVSIELDPDDITLVEVGGAADVVLPDGRRHEGTVTEVGRVVRPSGPEPDAPGVIEVVVSLPETVVDLDQAPVDVEVESERARDVLAVPVRALIALSDGGYAVDTGEALVGVEVGDFAGGLVEVSGAVEEGDEVVVPR
jgi:peptidoglycan hydrolase-like protein with peptidoglycan-binding domain